MEEEEREEREKAVEEAKAKSAASNELAQVRDNTVTDLVSCHLAWGGLFCGFGGVGVACRMPVAWVGWHWVGCVMCALSI